MMEQCDCHKRNDDSKKSKNAVLRLIFACVLAMMFVIGEFIGGYFSHSLAIMTDVVHMLSDFASFSISLFAIWMGTRPPSKRMSFGWYRAEVIGAIVSVLIIWILTCILVYEAILRIVHYNSEKIDADIMLVTACVAVFFNVIMCAALHQHHDHDDHSRNQSSLSKGEDNESSSRIIYWKNKAKKGRGADGRNINVRAAFIHVIGDLIQSIGVVIAGYIIKFFPQWHHVDSICTFIFSIFVIISTLNVLKDAILILMEGVPRNMDTGMIKDDLLDLPNVVQVHNIHIWSLTTSRVALAVHIAIDKKADIQSVLVTASKLLKNVYGFSSITLQVEHHQREMELCKICINKE